MGFLDRLLGREDRQPEPRQQSGVHGYRYGQQSYQVPAQQQQGWQQTPQAAGTDDERAVERYRYLLRTAPPERIEAVHAEAFANLTPEQRRMVYDEFTRTAPDGEAPRGDDPRSLAQAATRSELRQPGYVERSLGGMSAGGRGGLGGFGQRGGGFGSMLGASILGSVAGYVIGSSLMSAFLPDAGGLDGGTDASGQDDGTDGGADDGGDAGASDGGDSGGGTQDADWGGGFDQGGFGDFGGDFGGGDFDV